MSRRNDTTASDGQKALQKVVCVAVELMGHSQDTVVK